MTDHYSPPIAAEPYPGDPLLAPATAPLTPPLSPPPTIPPLGPNAASTDTADTKDIAKDQAASVGQGAAAAGQHVAGVAKEQTAQVTAEAGRQAKDLLNQAQGQVKEQAGAQQEKLVTGLRSLSDELGSMARGSEQPGVATDLARQAAERTGSVAGWLDGREPAAVLSDVQDFARRRPGAFLAIAGGIGFLAGRLTRGLKAQSDSASGSGAPAATSPAVPTVAPMPYPAAQTGAVIDLDAPVGLVPPSYHADGR